jgi:RNA polymerase sigma-70 factor (ECF subfamily)
LSLDLKGVKLKSERELVQKILSGDLNSFKKLIERYQKLVVHVVFRFISNNEDGEEICQEVFMKIYQNLSGFKFQSKLSTWIGKIAYTTTINYLRKHKILKNMDQKISGVNGNRDDGIYDPINTAHSEYLSPLEEIEKQEMASIVQQKIKLLPPPYQTIITLYHLDQMSYQEISEIMDLPEGTVKSYLFRGRKKLKDLLVLELEGESI